MAFQLPAVDFWTRCCVCRSVQVMDTVSMGTLGVQVERGGRQHLPFGEQSTGLGKFEFWLVVLEQMF